MRHEHNLVTGFLGQYDLDRDIVVVNVKNFPGLSPIVFRSRTTFPPHTNAVALGCDSDGKLIAKRGILNFDPSGDFLSRMLSTCKITEVHLRYNMRSILICFCIFSKVYLLGDKMMFSYVTLV